MVGKNNDHSKAQTVISEGTKIEGKLFFPGTVRIDGEIIGDIDAENSLIISKTGKVRSNIRTKNAVVAGSFEGDMHTTESIAITSTGKFTGTLVQNEAQFSIEKGGLFKGKSSFNGETGKKSYFKELRDSEPRD